MGERLRAIQRISSPNEGVAGFSTLKFVDMDCVFDGGFQGVQAGTGTVIGGGIFAEKSGKRFGAKVDRTADRVAPSSPLSISRRRWRTLTCNSSAASGKVTKRCGSQSGRLRFHSNSPPSGGDGSADGSVELAIGQSVIIG